MMFLNMPVVAQFELRTMDCAKSYNVEFRPGVVSK